MLPQPMEGGSVMISRVASSVTYPADFILIGVMNPCPCRYLGSRHRYCTSTPKQVTAYNNRMSGPIQDRMAILLKLDRVTLTGDQMEENKSSITIRKRVLYAREKQCERFNSEVYNANVSNENLLACSMLNQK